MTRRDFLSFLPFAPKVVASLSDKRNFIGDEILERVIQRSRKEGWARLPFGDVVAKVGLSFRGTPYEGWTLEQDTDREFCFVTLEVLDCVTFFESSLAIARMIRQGQSSPEQLLAQVTRTRYRDGVVGGYPSRLHYTCDWMDDNTRRKNVSKIDLAGAVPFGRTIDFMSKHTTRLSPTESTSGARSRDRGHGDGADDGGERPDSIRADGRSRGDRVVAEVGRYRRDRDLDPGNRLQSHGPGGPRRQARSVSACLFAGEAGRSGAADQRVSRGE